MSELIHLSGRQWQKKLQCSPLFLSDARLKLFDLESERDRLKSLADTLIKEWLENFPRASVPIYLTRVSDRSLTILRWRKSRTHNEKASQMTFDDDLLTYFHVSNQRKLVLKFESLRIDMNYQLSIILYQIQRLSNYIHEIETLTSLRNKEKE